MKKYLCWVCLLSLILFPTSLIAAEEAKKEEDTAVKKEESKKEEGKKETGMEFKVYFKDGLFVESKDKEKTYKIQLGGRFFYDWFWGTEDKSMLNVGGAKAGDFRDGSEVRAARLFIGGTIDEFVGFKVEADFAGGTQATSPSIKDAYISLHFPALKKFLNLKVGHFKEPFGLDELTSARFGTFIERASSNVFVPGRNVGISVYGNPNEMLTYAMGIFWTANDTAFGQGAVGAGDEGDYNFTARVTAAPLHDTKGGKILHLGVSYSYRNKTNAFGTRPPAHLAPTIYATGGTMRGDNHMISLEFAAVFGPFSLQGEYMATRVDVKQFRGGDPDLWGYYVQASFFITGESRAYSTKEGVFGRVNPKKNFMKDGGLGAIEAAIRFGEIDLESGAFGANAKGYDVTVGINWYLTPHMRFMLNWIEGFKAGASLGAVATGGGKFHIFETRWQIDF